MNSYVFSYRDNASGLLKEVRARGEDEEAGALHFKRLAPAIDIRQVEMINGNSFDQSAPWVARVIEAGIEPHSVYDELTKDFMGTAGCVMLAAGLTGFFVPHLTNILAQTLSITGAIFIAAHWRPR